mmetsp:Transcript_26470/g.29495  ORF Transcript_26470/g.29495 Transcript_26470/m.29495 type:complete len:509 (-) Transcript_26470:40-1566(-)
MIKLSIIICFFAFIFSAYAAKGFNQWADLRDLYVEPLLNSTYNENIGRPYVAVGDIQGFGQTVIVVSELKTDIKKPTPPPPAKRSQVPQMNDGYSIVLGSHEDIAAGNATTFTVRPGGALYPVGVLHGDNEFAILACEKNTMYVKRGYGSQCEMRLVHFNDTASPPFFYVSEAITLPMGDVVSGGFIYEPISTLYVALTEYSLLPVIINSKNGQTDMGDPATMSSADGSTMALGGTCVVVAYKESSMDATGEILVTATEIISDLNAFEDSVLLDVSPEEISNVMDIAYDAASGQYGLLYGSIVGVKPSTTRLRLVRFTVDCVENGTFTIHGKHNISDEHVVSTYSITNGYSPNSAFIVAYVHDNDTETHVAVISANGTVTEQEYDSGYLATHPDISFVSVPPCGFGIVATQSERMPEDCNTTSSLIVIENDPWFCPPPPTDAPTQEPQAPMAVESPTGMSNTTVPTGGNSTTTDMPVSPTGGTAAPPSTTTRIIANVISIIILVLITI